MRKTLKLVVCTILPAAWKPSENFVGDFITDLFAQCGRVQGVDTAVILSYETKGRSEWKIFEILLKKFPNLLLSPSHKVSTNADLYLLSFQLALGQNADLVLEIDCSGAHDATQIPQFIYQAVTRLQDDPTELLCVLSTRFSVGGENHFPKNRVYLSRLATIFAHGLLMLGKTGKGLSDLSSGFEAFSGALLRKMFLVRHPKDWVSFWWGPLHLFQTEARAFVCWVAKKERVTVFKAPINFAEKFDRKLAPLTIRYLTKALFGGLLLILEGNLVNTKIRQEN